MKVNFSLCKWQNDFLTDEHPVKVLLAGRRSGKTYASKVGLTRMGCKSSGNSAVIMPIAAQSMQFYTEMYTELMGEDNYRKLLKNDPKIWPYPQMKYKSGHTLEFRSFEKNPKRLRGGHYTGYACLDEANDLKGDEITKIVLPKIADTKGQILITSTITSFNWLWDLYLKGQKPDKMVKSWLVPSHEGPMFWGKEGRQRLEDLKSMTPKAIWDSEYLCIPQSDNTGAFPYFEQCIIDDLAPTQPQTGRKYIASLDLGRTRDYEVLTIIDDLGLVVLCEIINPNRDLTHEKMSIIVGTKCRFWNAKLLVDATGNAGDSGKDKDQYPEIYRKDTPDLMPFYWSANRENSTKANIISYVMLVTEQKRIKVPKQFAELIVQMKQYKIILFRGSNSTFGAPKGEHDDCVASLALAIWGLKAKWFKGASSASDINAAFSG